MDRIKENAVVRICGEDEEYYWLTEEAEIRLCRILTTLLVLALAPAFALAFMM